MAKKRCSKRPRIAYNLPEKKEPRVPPRKEEPFRWRTDYVDLSEGQWGWGSVSISNLFKEIIPKLLQFEESTWGELIGDDKIHFMDQSDIAPEAQKRLCRLAEEEVIPEDWLGTELASLRITGVKRIWGFKYGKYLYLLWWDPDHSVYPVEKRHT